MNPALWICNATRAFIASALLCCAFGPFPATAAAVDKLEAQLASAGQALVDVQPAATADYLDGDPDRALKRFLAVTDQNDWKSLFALGNVLFTQQPDESFRLHQRAYELSRHNDLALLELAYDYTRRDDCAKALDAWKRVDAAGLFGSYMPMLAAYCHLKLGDDAQAFAMMDRSTSRYGQLENSLKDLWGEPVLRTHAEALRRFRTTGASADLDAALENSVRFGVGHDRGRALLAMANAAANAKTSSGEMSAQLECLRPAFGREAALPTDSMTDPDAGKDATRDVWKQRMSACGFAIEGRALPANAALARVLVVTAIDLDLAPAQDLLVAHSKQLDDRARSKAGDIAALRLLAAMQARVDDPALEESDELGWSRYGDADFAASRLNDVFRPGATPTPGDVARLNQAHRQFPDDARVLLLWLRHATPSKDEAREGWRKLALLEFHEPNLQRDNMHFQPTAFTLYEALREYRKAAGL